MCVCGGRGVALILYFNVFLFLLQIGTAFTRGVSGGQRKRTAIAMELIVSPGVLFLDEPTSGLDSTTAISVIKILHELVLSSHTTTTLQHT